MIQRVAVVVLGAMALAGVSSVAVAGPTVVAGGPAPRDRGAMSESLDRVAGALGVCWRGKRPATVRVAIDVAADGGVKSATAKTRGKVATCAAAVLAVQTLARASRGYKATVEFPTSGGGGTAGTNVRDAVGRGVRDSADVRACYSGVRGLAGRVQVKFVVRPNGRVVDAEAVASTVSPKSVETCLVRAIRGLSLGKLATDKSVEFTMPFSFDGGGGSAASGGELRPQKNGPLAGDILDSVMKPAVPRFTACYDAQARKEPSLAGDVVIRFTIGADGTTRNAKVKQSTLGNAKVESCMVDVAKKLKFPAERGRKDTRVIYPFRFAQTR